jgi:hypothetical protein
MLEQPGDYSMDHQGARGQERSAPVRVDVTLVARPVDKEDVQEA